jgi:hypothetical protein
MEFAAVLALISGLSLVITKVVDFIRNLPWFKDKFVGSWVWNAVAFVAGIALCVGWNKNFVGDLMRVVPALAGDADSLKGFSGELLSGMLLGGLSGFAHELLDALSGVASRAHTQAGPVTDRT